MIDLGLVLHVTITAVCLGVGCLLVAMWREIIFWVFQCLTVIVMCSGLLVLVIGQFWPELPACRWIDDVAGSMLEQVPISTGRLFFVQFLFSGIPLAVFFRAICFRLVPWLELFCYPPEWREALLATGVRPEPAGWLAVTSNRFVRCFAGWVIASAVILGPLIVLTRMGATFASVPLDILSNVGLLLFCLGTAGIGMWDRRRPAPVR